MAKERRIGVVGLGYVGLPLALAFARKFPGTMGFDSNAEKVKALKAGVDPTGEGLEAALRSSTLTVTDSCDDMRECDFFVGGVPTPIDIHKNPDLEPLHGACRFLGPCLKPGDIIAFESTVYPGVTEEICGPWLERYSGLKQGQDFKLAYSPERINPGDRQHTLERILKVVSGEDEQTLQIAAEVYSSIIEAGIYKAPSIKVAEAAKVIENTQRDLNIALMNELAIIFDLMGIRSKDVFEAAATKWNFNRYSPGLVGGHCIGVDPFYLTTKAEELGYRPQVILAGRRINDNMGRFIAQKTVKLLARNGARIRDARVGVLGLTFKENVSDLRNSRVPDIIAELREFGAQVITHDAYADPAGARHEYGVELSELESFIDLDALILAVAHDKYMQMGPGQLAERIKRGGVFIDVKSVLHPGQIPGGLTYWSL